MEHNEFLDWLVEESQATEQRLRHYPHASPEWIMAMHRMETLDECLRKYRRVQRKQSG